MKQKGLHTHEIIVKENRTLKTILFVVGILFLIAITVSATLLFVHRKTVALKLAQFLAGTGVQQTTQLSQSSDQIIVSTTKSPAQMDTYKSRSVEYINCKHSYSFFYPQEWSNNGMTSESDIVELYGQGITGRITAMYYGSPLNEETLYVLANDRLKSTKGTQIGSRDKMRNNVHILAYDFKDPRSLFVLWQWGNYQVEMRFSGNWGQWEEDNLGYLLATFKPGATDTPLCQGSQATTNTAVTQIQQTTQQYECSFPNGDVEFWWNDVSQDVRDCYISKYGWPSFALPDPNQGDAGADCSFPNGDVEYWWDSASQETRDCFLQNGGIPPR